jgi:hypothetical protein
MRSLVAKTLFVVAAAVLVAVAIVLFKTLPL